MPNPPRTWQLVNLLLALALIAALVELHRSSTDQCRAKGTLPTDNTTGYERLALSPNARRAHERYLL